ncbi:MAG TPA: GTPase, partial [Massilia sp.]|nr:GTPase [Massilia sp.]
VGEIGATTEAMVRGFAAEHGLTLSAPPGLSLARYRAEIDAIEALYAKQFGTATLLMTSRATLMERFFDSIASRVRRTFR